MFYGGSRRKDAITEIDVESTPVRSLTHRQWPCLDKGHRHSVRVGELLNFLNSC